MSEDSTQSDAALPARRRIVALPERRTPLPVAIIAHDGPELDELEAHVARTRPVVTFPSLAHFGADVNRREKWAGIVIARPHAWDARLDESVPRRAFIALYGLADEGHGWPDSVRRASTTEDLDAWLTAIGAPVLPADDRRRAAKQRPKRSVFTMSLAEPSAVSSGPTRASQLILPSLSVAAAGSAEAQPARASARSTASTAGDLKARDGESPGDRSQAAHGTSTLGKSGAAGRKSMAKAPEVNATTSAKPTAGVARGPTSRAPDRNALGGLRLTSYDVHEQAVLDAARVLGVASARAIVNAIDACELS